MTTRDLPYDLIHSVISRERDVSTLKACSLVSSLWHQACRPFIFRRVKVIDDDRLTALERLLDISPEIAEFVQELTIRPYHPPDEAIPLPTPWIARFPDVLSPRLTKLNTICLVDFYDYGEFMDHAFFPRLAAFTTVERLIFRDCGLVKSFIYSVICSFVNLRHLYVYCPRPLASMLEEPPPRLHSPHLFSATLDIGARFPDLFDSLIDWLATTPVRTSLRSFSAVVHMLDSAKMAGFLREIGGTLERLEIRLLKFSHARMEYELIKQDIDLSVCTALRTLILDGVDPAGPAIIHFLSQVSSPHLRKVVLPFVAKDVDHIPTHSPLAASLEDNHLAGLTEVCFLYNGSVDYELVLSKLQEELPEVNARGILRLIVDPDYEPPIVTQMY